MNYQFKAAVQFQSSFRETRRTNMLDPKPVITYLYLQLPTESERPTTSVLAALYFAFHRCRSHLTESLKTSCLVCCIKTVELAHGLAGFMPQLNGDTAPLRSLDAGTTTRTGRLC